MDEQQAGPDVTGAAGGGYNTRGKARLSPDQRAKLQETMINNYQPLEALPSKAVQRQRAHQEAAREEAAAAAARRLWWRHRAHSTPSAVHSGAPRKQYASPPRAGLPSHGSPTRVSQGGPDFVQNVAAQAMGRGYGDSLDAQASFHSQHSRSIHESNDAWGSMEQMQQQQQARCRLSAIKCRCHSIPRNEEEEEEQEQEGKHTAWMLSAPRVQRRWTPSWSTGRGRSTCLSLVVAMPSLSCHRKSTRIIT